jgi:PAS domain S-box-containing protein
MNDIDVASLLPHWLVKSKALLVVVTDLNGRYSYVNELYKQRFSVLDDEILGVNSVDVVHPDDVSIMLDCAAKCLEDPGSTHIVQLRKPQKNNNGLHTSQWEFTTLHNSDQEVIGILCIGNDITQSKNTETRLEQQQFLLRSLVDNNFDGIYVTNGEQFTYVNQRFCDLLEYSHDELTSKSFHINSLLPESSRQIVEDRRRARLAKEDIASHTSIQIITKSGSIKDVETSTVPLDDVDGEIRVLGIMHDVSERLNNERALRASEARFRTLVEHIPSLAIQSYKPDGTITYWNTASEHVYGYSADEAIGVSIFDLLFSDEDGARMSAFIKECVTLGVPIPPYELSLYRKDGTKVITYSSQAVAKNEYDDVEIYCVDIDLTELHKARRQLEQLVEWFDHSSDAVQVADESGIIIFANAETQRRLGKPLSEILGSHVSTIEKIFEGEQAWHVHVKHLKRAGSMILEGVHKRVDGSEFPVEASVTYQETHGTGYIVAFIRDITDRKMSENEIRTALDIVSEQNQRLLNFNYIISHNVRSHASNIHSLLEMMLDKVDASERAEIELHLQSASQNLMTTIEDLNKVVVIQKNINEQRLEINLSEAVNKTLSVLKGEIQEKDITIRDEVPNDLLINFNPAYLDSILLNLISNAVKYSDLTRSSFIQIRTELQEDHILLEVIDNGYGIDLKKHGEKMFTMYKTFHGNPDARGLGLFITKNQVEALGGKIEVDSKPGTGSTFRVFFPCKS